ncbi:MAG: DMT family transporter [Firmicutes bacterium]|jgi:drug/metabolite transporter (DMT)-like permease|nr:DMT family transporter [Bacillota bacterium]
MERVSVDNKSNLRGQFFGFLSCLMWGLAFLYNKILIKHFDFISINFYRYVVGTVALVIIVKLMRINEKIKKKDIMKIVSTGVLGMALYNVFTTLSLKYLPTTICGVFNGAIPILTVFIEYAIIQKKKMPRRLVFIACVSFLGIALVVLGSNSGSIGSDYKGYLFLILSIFSWIYYTFASKDILDRYNTLIVLKYQIICAMILFVIPMAFKGNSVIAEMVLFSKVEIVGSLIGLGVFCSAFAYIFYAKGLLIIGQSQMSFYTNLMPVISIIGGLLVLGETTSIIQMSGVVIVVMSVFFKGGS